MAAAADLRNLLQTMSSVFNETPTDEPLPEIKNDETLKWKNLQKNNNATKERRKTKLNLQNETKTETKKKVGRQKNKVITVDPIEVEDFHPDGDDSWECNSQHSLSSDGSYSPNKRRRKTTKKEKDKISTKDDNKRSNKKEKQSQPKTVNSPTKTSTKNIKNEQNNEPESSTIKKEENENPSSAVVSVEPKVEPMDEIENIFAVTSSTNINEIYVESIPLTPKQQEQGEQQQQQQEQQQQQQQQQQRKSPSSFMSDGEIFRSFGHTIASQLKELNKFSKIEAQIAMQEIQNLVAERIVKILAKEEELLGNVLSNDKV